MVFSYELAYSSGSAYATADAGIISMVLHNLADGIEKNNPGAKELRMWAENNTTKPELQETIKVKKPNMR